MKDDIDHVTSWNLNTSIDTSTNLLTMAMLVATLLVSKCKTDNESLPAVQWLYTCILVRANLQCESNGSFCGGHFHGESILLGIPGLDYAHNIAASSGVKRIWQLSKLIKLHKGNKLTHVVSSVSTALPPCQLWLFSPALMVC